MADEVLDTRLTFPAYEAEIKCRPTLSVEVLSVADPLLSRVDCPNAAPPSKNVTVPVGNIPETATMAWKVTFVPTGAGFGETLRVVVVLSGRTSNVKGCEVLAVNAASPEYTAVSECAPAVSDEVFRLEVPLLRALLPRLIGPSKNVTEPEGDPARAYFATSGD